MLDISSRLSAALLAFYGIPGTGCPDIPMWETAMRVVEAGLGVEVLVAEGWENRQLPSDETVGRIAEAVKGAPMISTHAFVKRWNPEVLRKEVLVSQRIGATQMVIHPYVLGQNLEDHPFDAQAAKDECLFALDHGVTFALENLAATGIESMRRSLDVFGTDTKKTGLGICIDVGHAHREGSRTGITPVDYLREFRDVIIELHVHDNLGHKDLHQPPGTCAMDWPPIVQAMLDLPEKTVVCLEMIARERPIEALREAREFLLSHTNGRYVRG